MVDYATIPQSEWDILPTSDDPAKVEWAKLMDDLMAGHVIAIKCKEQDEAKNIRISLARRAGKRGMKLAARFDGKKLAVRCVEWKPEERAYEQEEVL